MAVTQHSIMSSVIWKFFERIGTQGVQFVITIALARLLAPSYFGAIALVMVFINIAQAIVQAGLNTALIQKENADELDFSSAFILSFGVALGLYAALFIASPSISKFYNNADLIPIFRVLGTLLLLGALNSIQESYLSRNMMFKKLFIRSISAAIPSGVIGISLAYLHFGLWALVAQQISRSVIICAIMWLTVKWRPRLMFSFDRALILFSYSWKILVTSILSTIYTNMRNMIIGKMFSPIILGFYNRGEQVPAMAINSLNGTLSAVMFPAMSSFQNDRIQLKRILRRALTVNMFLIFPAMIGIAVTAAPLVAIIFGKKWLPCVPYLQISCIATAFLPINALNLAAINSLGFSNISLRLEIIKRTAGTLVIAATACVFRTPISIAISGVIFEILECLIDSFPNKKLLSYGYWEQVIDILPFLSAAVVMGIAMFVCRYLNLLPYWMLALQSFVGLAVYLGISKAFQFKPLDYLLSACGNHSEKR